MLTKRLLELAGLILIANGVIGLIFPRRHTLFWHAGPELAKAITEEIGDHPKTSRAISAAQMAVGVALTTIDLSNDD